MQQAYNKTNIQLDENELMTVIRALGNDMRNFEKHNPKEAAYILGILDKIEPVFFETTELGKMMRKHLSNWDNA